MKNNTNHKYKSVLLNLFPKWMFLGISILLLGILFCYIVFSFISSKRLLDTYNSRLVSIEVVNKVRVNDSDVPTVTGLLYKKAFLESQLALLDNDSLNMVIDLKDSVVSLMIEGVIVYTTPIKKYSISKFFKALSKDAYIQVFSKPLFVDGYDATIVKEPITIKQAPKDTLEAENFFEMPDTLVNAFATIRMHLNRGFLLNLCQNEKSSTYKDQHDRFFFLRLHFRKIKNDLSRMLHFRLPAYEPEISITLPKSDLVTLFRALPDSIIISMRLR
jgi:hypothetical protein